MYVHVTKLNYCLVVLEEVVKSIIFDCDIFNIPLDVIILFYLSRRIRIQIR